jgi:subtilisin family serine protease
MLKLVKFRLAFRRARFLALLAALPAALIVATPVANLDRFVASVPLRNWGLQNSVSNSHIHAVDAWKLEEGSRDVVVAVIDTGIDANHPDIKPNLWHDHLTGNYGWDFVANKANPTDDHSHGTHVAGILGATMNAKAGISGVAHRVSIMAVKYYSDHNTGAENLKNSIKALNWAIDHGANIINYSGGGPEFSGEEYAALKRARDKGILLVAAAGNEHQNSDVPENFYYPCAYRLDNIICVAAINIKNEMLASSNWGKVRVDVAAPGENILSTVPGSKDAFGNYNPKYAYMSGTSQATAFVTGLAALLLAKDHKLHPDQIRDIIRSSSDKLAGLHDKVFSGGKVNAYAALAQLEHAQHPAPIPVAARSNVLSAPAKTSARKISSKKSKASVVSR